MRQHGVLLRRELGFTAIEVNASDTRNKSDKSAVKGVAGKLSNGIREMATNVTLDMHAGEGQQGKKKARQPRSGHDVPRMTCPAGEPWTCMLGVEDSISPFFVCCAHWALPAVASFACACFEGQQGWL